ncbi:hypothetical protein VTL71DRAFT_8138 [Oculimacula yallundae]|uniref:Uncharacterized protein n=1 Tax=Oculimacula yallundae TaxID=86028 RepID=A0ABR4CWU9_9HELO
MVASPHFPDTDMTSERQTYEQPTSKRWLDEQMFARQRPWVRAESSITSTAGNRQAQVNSSLTSQGWTLQECLENSGKTVAPRERADAPSYIGLRKQSNTYKKRKASSNTFDAKVFVEKPRPKKKKKEVAKPEFTIFEDETATKAANPTPEDIKNDPDYYHEFGDEAAICFYTTLIRQGTKRMMQEHGYLYAISLIELIKQPAIDMDSRIPHTGIGFHSRLTTWLETQIWNKTYGISHPNGFKHTYPRDEEEWFTVEAVEELAKLMTDLHDTHLRYEVISAPLPDMTPQHYEEFVHPILTLLAGYCFGHGCGMDVGSPAFGDYLDDGKRNPEFFNRLTKAWSTIVDFHLGHRGEDFEGFWCGETWTRKWSVDQVRDSMKRKGVNWKAMEHFWGDTYPPCDNLSRFGGKARVRGEDPDAAEMFQIGIDGY